MFLGSKRAFKGAASENVGRRRELFGLLAGDLQKAPAELDIFCQFSDHQGPRLRMFGE